MKKFGRFSLLLLILFANSAFSQDSGLTTRNYIRIVLKFEKYVRKYYRPDENQVKALCENSCIFIRFKILKNGTISDLAFSKNTVGFTQNVRNTPSAITDALIRAFKSAATRFQSYDVLASDERTYLLPFIYY